MCFARVTALPPQPLEAGCGGARVSDGMRDVPVAEIILNEPRVVIAVRQIIRPRPNSRVTSRHLGSNLLNHQMDSGAASYVVAHNPLKRGACGGRGTLPLGRHNTTGLAP